MSNLKSNRLIELLPPNMTDASIKSISYAIDREHKKLVDNIKNVILLGDIGNASTYALDALSLDLGIEDYDITLSKQIKLELFKENIYRNKFTRGTARTVARAVDILYGGAKVIEASESLKPYEFAVKVQAQSGLNADSTSTLYANIKKVVEKAKNTRSHLAGITMYIPTQASVFCASHHTTATRIKVLPYMPSNIATQPTNPAMYAVAKTGTTIQIQPKGVI